MIWARSRGRKNKAHGILFKIKNKGVSVAWGGVGWVGVAGRRISLLLYDVGVG